jgi:anti-sigma regulatory factor (Ser/Thr protein kinase)
MSTRWNLKLPSEETSPREARRWVAQRLAEAGYGDPDTALLIVSELVANVVQHGGGGTVRVTVRVAPGEWAQLEVKDDMAAPGQPLAFPVAPPPADAEHGRGLLLVGALSATCGTDGHGTTWARLPWTAASAPADDGALFPLPAVGGAW